MVAGVVAEGRGVSWALVPVKPVRLGTLEPRVALVLDPQRQLQTGQPPRTAVGRVDRCPANLRQGLRSSGGLPSQPRRYHHPGAVGQGLRVAPGQRIALAGMGLHSVEPRAVLCAIRNEGAQLAKRKAGRVARRPRALAVDTIIVAPSHVRGQKGLSESVRLFSAALLQNPGVLARGWQKIVLHRIRNRGQEAVVLEHDHIPGAEVLPLERLRARRTVGPPSDTLVDCAPVRQLHPIRVRG
mmetsp:Transcript_37864/g.108576  ORF Transcript_37864/g.108576 Transcript_37864/m.108576 type:complete len:241 (-) Transcript_37864:421-1143(-)